MGKNYSVRVVTGDGLVRLSSMRSGVIVVPSVDFDAELREVLTGIDRMLKKDGHSQLTRKLGEIPVKKDGEQ